MIENSDLTQYKASALCTIQACIYNQTWNKIIVLATNSKVLQKVGGFLQFWIVKSVKVSWKNWRHCGQFYTTILVCSKASHTYILVMKHNNHFPCEKTTNLQPRKASPHFCLRGFAMTHSMLETTLEISQKTGKCAVTNLLLSIEPDRHFADSTA